MVLEAVKAKTKTQTQLVADEVELDLDYGLGLSKALNKRLKDNEDNTKVICEYARCLEIEINPSESYKKLNARILLYLSEYHGKNKKFKELTKEDIISFLGSLRKNDDADPLHSWIAYNAYLVILARFFKWLH